MQDAAAREALIPIEEGLRSLGLSDKIAILPVDSGYPSPRKINLVLMRRYRGTYLFEASANTPEVRGQIEAALKAARVDRLDALLVTHCHGDHAGTAGVFAGWGRPEGDRAPIHVHSRGYRFLTMPEVATLEETYTIFLHRAHFGLMDYSELSPERMMSNPQRRLFNHYFAKTPKTALRFVDQGLLPEAMTALFTPGHSHDCMMYYDAAFGVAVPGDTILTTGAPDDPATWDFVIPIFTVAEQNYSRGFESFMLTIQRLRRFFASHDVRLILPPHGRFAVRRPMAWVEFAERYFKGIYRAFLDDFLARREGDAPFTAMDVCQVIPSAGAHRVSTPSHVFGMLCALSEEGLLEANEDINTRMVRFRVVGALSEDYLERRLSADPGPLPLYRAGA